MFSNLTTVTQGGIGMAQAIATFAKLGHTVSIPLIDNQGYDLIVDKDGQLLKVQVKTTKQKAPSNNYVVELRRIRANRTQNTIHTFNNQDTDLLYILTEEGVEYIIPCLEITAAGAITLGQKYDKYRLEGSAKVAKRT